MLTKGVLSFVLVIILSGWVTDHSFNGKNPYEIYERDAKEIKSKSRLLINEYEGLLNLISNSEIFQSEVVEVIDNSYSSTNVNRLFKDSKIVVEDDLNPEIKNSFDATNVDISYYLSNFNLLYEKTIDYSISFEDIKVSEIYFKDYMFLNVFFTTNYSSTSKRYSSSFEKRTRVAEVQIEKGTSGWDVFIVGLRFARPNESFDERLLVDVLKPVENERVTVAEIDEQPVSEAESPENLIFYVVEDEEAQRYNSAMNLGNRAFKDGRFEDAIEQFSKARSFRNNDPLSTSMQNKSQLGLNAQLKLNTTERSKIIENQSDVLAYRSEFDLAIQTLKRAIILSPNNENLKLKLNLLEQRLVAQDEVNKYFLTFNNRPESDEFKKLSRQNPRNPDYKYGLAKAYLAERDTTEDVRKSKELKLAMVTINDALKIEPQFKEGMMLRAELLEIEGDFQGSLRQLDELIALESDEAELYFRKAQVKLNQKDVEGAINELNLALTQDGNNIPSTFLLGKIYFNQKQFEKSSEFFGKATLLDRNNPSFYFYRGLALAEFDFKSATQNLQTAKDLGGEQIEQDLLTQFRILVEKNFSQREELGLDKSLENIDLLLSLGLESSIGFLRKGQLLKQLGRYLEAREVFSAMLEKEPKSTSLTLELAEVDYLIGDYEKSIVGFNLLSLSMPKSNPSSELISTLQTRVNNGLGDNHMALFRYEKAYEYFQLSLKNGLNLPYTFQRLGQAKIEAKDYKQAIKDLSEGIKAHEGVPELFFYRGLALYKDGDFKGSMSDFNRAKSLDFNLPYTNYYISMIGVGMDNYRLAISSIQEAIQLKDNEFDFYPLYFMLSLNDKNLENVKLAISKMNELSVSGRLESKFCQGVLFLYNSDLSGANRTLVDMFALDPTNPEAIFLSGMIFLKEGKNDLAYTNLERAFESNQLDRFEVVYNPVFNDLRSDKRINRLANQYFK